MLSIDRWPEAVNYATHTHNIVPITRKTQHDGSGIPPLVELSNAHSNNGVLLQIYETEPFLKIPVTP
jgi:hypothetical protein